MLISGRGLEYGSRSLTCIGKQSIAFFKSVKLKSVSKSREIVEVVWKLALEDLKDTR